MLTIPFFHTVPRLSVRYDPSEMANTLGRTIWGWSTAMALAASVVVAPPTTIASAPQPQQNRSREFGPRACGPADPTYIRMANETGGQPFFLSPAEVAKSEHIMRAGSLGDRELILWASGSSEGAAHAFPIPVDSSVTRMTIAASFDRQGGTLTVIDSSGSVDARPPGFEETILNCAHLLTVDRPPTGTWQARIVATGRFWLVVHGRTELSLTTAEFVRDGGRPGHEGLFRIAGQPIANKPATLRARVSDAPATPRFALVSTEGAILQEVDLSKVGDEELVGAIALPRQPFRVAAFGKDAAGLTYQRMYAPLFHAETVELTITGDDSLRAGSSAAISVVVRNHGPAARYRIVAVDGRGVVSRVEPQTVEIAEGSEASVRVWLTPPADAAPNSFLDLTVTAEGVGKTGGTNSAVHHFAVMP